MPAMTPISSDQFNTLHILLSMANIELTERIAEAHAAGNKPLMLELEKRRVQVMQDAINLKWAEIAFSNSAMSHKDAVAKLFDAVKYANRGVQELQDLVNALTGATRIVNLLRRIVSLFP